jgi:hypothetical protein
MLIVLYTETFGFHDNEIITITDKEGASLLPTRETIVSPITLHLFYTRSTFSQMREVRQFIIREQNNTDYVLFCKPLHDSSLALDLTFLKKIQGIPLNTLK